MFGQRRELRDILLERTGIRHDTSYDTCYPTRKTSGVYYPNLLRHVCLPFMYRSFSLLRSLLFSKRKVLPSPGYSRWTVIHRPTTRRSFPYLLESQPQTTTALPYSRHGRLSSGNYSSLGTKRLEFVLELKTVVPVKQVFR